MLSKSFSKKILAGIIGAAKPLLLGEVPEQSRRADPSSNGAGRAPRNPGKWVKMPSLAFLPTSFLLKTRLIDFAKT